LYVELVNFSLGNTDSILVDPERNKLLLKSVLDIGLNKDLEASRTRTCMWVQSVAPLLLQVLAASE